MGGRLITQQNIQYTGCRLITQHNGSVHGCRLITQHNSSVHGLQAHHTAQHLGPWGAGSSHSTTARFLGRRLIIEDESSQHAGHAGVADRAEGSGESHFRIHLTCAAFEGLNTLKRHRLVYQAGLSRTQGMSACHVLAAWLSLVSISRRSLVCSVHKGGPSVS